MRKVFDRRAVVGCAMLGNISPCVNRQGMAFSHAEKEAKRPGALAPEGRPTMDVDKGLWFSDSPQRLKPVSFPAERHD
jgi:hypothetical protein